MSDEITDKAMLGLPSLDVGHIITSAFCIALTALTVRSSGSPGPQPTQINSCIKNPPIFLINI